MEPAVEIQSHWKRDVRTADELARDLLNLFDALWRNIMGKGNVHVKWEGNFWSPVRYKMNGLHSPVQSRLAKAVRPVEFQGSSRESPSQIKVSDQC